MTLIVKDPALTKLKLWCSERILEFVEKLPEIKKGILSRLQSEAKHRKEDRFFWSDPIPNSCEFNLLCLSLNELIPYEYFDFKKLAKLCSATSTKRFFLSLSKPNETFDNLEKMVSQGGNRSWNYGILDFSDNVSGIKSKYIDYACLTIEQSETNFERLVFTIFPNTHFKKELNNILRKTFYSEIYLYFRFYFKKFFLFTGRRSSDGKYRKFKALESLINDLRQEFVLLVSNYLPNGLFLKRNHEIPCLEFWTFKGSFPEEPKEEKHLYSREDRFWNAVHLSKKAPYTFSDSKNSIIFSLPEGASSPSIKFITNYEKTEDYVAMTGGGAYYEIIDPLLLHWSLRELLADRVNQLKRFRSNILAERREIFKKRLFEIKQQVLQMNIDCKRIIDIFLSDLKALRVYCSRYTEILEGHPAADSFRIKFDDFLPYQLERTTAEFQKLEKEIVEYTDNATNIFTIHSNYKIQTTMLFLTWVILIFTVVQIILAIGPEKIIQEIIRNYLWPFAR